jgi:hypothetical protein
VKVAGLRRVCEGNGVREVIEAYTSTDGKPYVVLSNLSDPTWQKTLSLAELESGSQYIRLPHICGRGWPFCS